MIGTRAAFARASVSRSRGWASSGSAVRARFGDDEVCAILPGGTAGDAYKLAEEVSARLREGPDGFEVDAGAAEYPAHAADAEALVSETLKALGTAKRVGGGGIVVAR